MIHITGLSSLDGGAGDVMAPSIFDLSVNPISTRGGRFCHQITTGTPGFSDLLTALYHMASRPRDQGEIVAKTFLHYP